MHFRFFAFALLLGCCSITRGLAQSNDNFNSALNLDGTNVTATGSNIGTTKEIGEADHAGNPGGKSVWWKWSAPATGSVIIQTKGSTFDTLLAVYTGTSVANLARVASDDDQGTIKTSTVGFDVISGTVYRIAVDGFNGAAGEVHLEIAFQNGPLPRPVNDNFANRLPLRGSVATAVGGNLLASKESGEPSHANEIGGSSVWWTWTAPASGDVTIKTAGSDFDTLLAVYTGTVLTNLGAIASSDDINRDQPTSSVTFNAIANTVYQVAVDGFDGEPGQVKLAIAMSNIVWLDTPSRLANGAFRIAFTATAGKRYAIEASTDLVAWTEVMTAEGSTEPIVFVDEQAASLAYRFYRVRGVQ